MDKRLENMIDHLEDIKIGIDDTFDFKCRSCGKCCRNRHDILLSPKELFRIAKHLGISIEDTLDKYCEVFLGQDSKLPLVRLQPIGGNYRCPFLDGRKCRIHAAKPTICAMFPIGRMIASSQSSVQIEEIEPDTIIYILNKPGCEHKHREQTVRQWLEKWNVAHPDQYFLDWSHIYMKVSMLIMEFEKHSFKYETIEKFFDFVFCVLYSNYQMELEFEPQFESNKKFLENKIDSLDSILKGKDADTEAGGNNG